MTIDRLLKKNNLTGWDVGRIMIADLLELYKKQCNGDLTAKEGILSEKDKVTLVHGLQTNEDKRDYNLFGYVHDFITTIPMRIAYNRQLFENASFKLHHIVDLTHLAELENGDRTRQPLIVSSNEFEEIKADYQAKEKAKTYTPEELFFNELERLVKLYEVGYAPKEFYDIIEAMEQEPITNKRIIDNFYDLAPLLFDKGGYYQTKDGKRQDEVDPVLWFELLNYGEVEFIEEKELKETYNKIWLLPIYNETFNIEGCIKSFYYSGCTGTTSTFNEFKQDYPTIYEYVWDILLKAIPALKGCTEANLFKPIITGEELYNKDLLGYKQRINNVKKEGYNDIAISQANHSYGYYSVLFNVYRAEKLLDRKDTIDGLISEIRDALVEINCTNALLKILSAKTDLEDIYNLFSTDTRHYIDTIYYLNDRVKELVEYEIVRNGTEPLITDTDYNNIPTKITTREPIPQEELRARVKEALPLINYRLYEPSSRIVNNVSRNFSFENFYGTGNGVIDILIKLTNDGNNVANEKGE